MPSVSEIGVLDGLAAELGGSALERGAALLQADHPVGDGEGLDDVLLDQHDGRAFGADRGSRHRTSRMTIGARPSEISSQSSRLGFEISARPMATICCWPPDRRGARRAPPRAQDREQLVERRQRPAARAARGPSAPTSRFSSTVSGEQLAALRHHGDAAPQRCQPRAGRRSALRRSGRRRAAPGSGR